MQGKLLTKQRRVNRSRKKILYAGAIRMSVQRTPNHIYAQIFSGNGAEVLACASSVEKVVRDQNFGPGKVCVAEAVGKLVAERALEKGLSKIAFDRSGYRYHGRIKALAEAARAQGLQF